MHSQDVSYPPEDSQRKRIFNNRELRAGKTRLFQAGVPKVGSIRELIYTGAAAAILA